MNEMSNYNLKFILYNEVNNKIQYSHNNFGMMLFVKNKS